MFFAAQSFCQAVRSHLRSGDVLQPNNFILNSVSDKMMANINVFRSCMRHRVLRESYREQWLRENRPYWLESVLARYDLAISRWLTRSKQLEEALREYDKTSTLPPPSEFGLGTRPEQKE